MSGATYQRGHKNGLLLVALKKEKKNTKVLSGRGFVQSEILLI